jgi:putative iron-dependent peroxidase
MEVLKYQLGIADKLSSSASFVMFNLKKNCDVGFGLKVLQRFVDGKNVVAGFGSELLSMFDVPSTDDFQQGKFNSKLIPSNNSYDLVLWIKSDDNGEIFHQAISIKKALSDYFEFDRMVSSYTYKGKYDLSGFEDGIENAKGDDIVPVSIVESDDKLNGSSFWVLQQWLHDFDWLHGASQSKKEECIGRSLDDSHQFDDLKDFAHVKKSAKENFSPEAELLRRSMPWSDDNLNGGFMFSAFANSFRPFNLQMASMLGESDGIVDGVFKFSKIMNTSYLWCPPFKTGKLDISLLKK